MVITAARCNIFTSAAKKQNKQKPPSALGLFLVDFDSRQPHAGMKAETRRKLAAHLLPARLFCILEAKEAGPQSEGGVSRGGGILPVCLKLTLGHKVSTVGAAAVAPAAAAVAAAAAAAAGVLYSER